MTRLDLSSPPTSADHVRGAKVAWLLLNDDLDGIGEILSDVEEDGRLLQLVCALVTVMRFTGWRTSDPEEKLIRKTELFEYVEAVDPELRSLWKLRQQEEAGGGAGARDLKGGEPA